MKDQGKAVMKMMMIANDCSGEVAIRCLRDMLKLSDAQVRKAIENNSFTDDEIEKVCDTLGYTLMFVPNKFLEYCPVF